MQPQPPPQPPQPSYAWDAAARLIGALLLIPAVVLAVLTLVIPTVQTIRTSFRAETLIPEAEAESVGLDNYDRLLDHPQFWPSLWFSISLVIAPILVAVVVAPLVSAAFNWAGGWARLTARIVLSLTLVVFSPVALAIAWQRALGDDEPPPLADFDKVDGAMRTSVGMMTFGAVCAVGVMLFLPTFRAREQRRSIWPPMFTIAGVTVLGLLAIGLQQFTIPFVMTSFGPANETTTPVGLMYRDAFQSFEVGMGAAASSVLLALLGLLGVAAVLIVILTRLRISLLPFRQRRPASAGPAESVNPTAGPSGPVPPSASHAPMPTATGPAAPMPRAAPTGPAASAPPARINPGAIVVGALVLIAVAVVVVLNARPWLDALSGDALNLPSDAQSRTWTPAILWTLVSVGVAYLAAIGIGGLRPLGRHSEWLLLPFAPWLFVGIAPLGIEFFMSLQEEGDIDADTALRPQILVSILSLVVLTILCRGQSERWRRQVAAGAPAGGTFFLTVVLPTLPLAGLLAVATVFIHAQELLWPLLTITSPENDTTPLAMVRAQGTLGAQEFSVAAATPLLAVILGFVVLVAAQVLHLDRMVAATGEADELAADQFPRPSAPVAGGPVQVSHPGPRNAPPPPGPPPLARPPSPPPGPHAPAPPRPPGGAGT